jgi:hypothetical protein
MTGLHGVLDGPRKVNVLAVSRRQPEFKECFEVFSFTGEVKGFWDIIGWEIKVQFD